MKKYLLAILLAQSCFTITNAQKVLMQGWYWDYPKTAAGYSWADTLRLKAASLKQAGITDIWVSSTCGCQLWCRQQWLRS